MYALSVKFYYESLQVDFQDQAYKLEDVFLLLCVFALAILSDAHKHKLETPDFLKIVDAVKKDIDSHLKALSNIRVNVETISSQTKHNPSEGKGFMKILKDGKDFHLVKNVGLPSDAGNLDLSLTLKKTRADPSEESKYESIMTDASESISHYPEPSSDLDLSVSLKKTKAYPSEESQPESIVVTDAAETISQYPKPLPSESTSADYESSTHGYPINAGSVKGLPGVTFPDYDDIPITSFTCSDKEYVPGFYADLECGCQVFHVCWPDRRESFLCPVGTTFNQALLACDYWYSSNCSLAPHYYSVNAEATSEKDENTSSMIDLLLQTSQKSEKSSESSLITSESVLEFISHLMPVKAKVVVYPETANRRSKIVASASIGEKRKSASKVKNQKTESDLHDSSRPAKVHDLDDTRQSTVICTVSEESKSRYNVIAARLNEALENVLKEVKLDKSMVQFYPTVESIVKSIRGLLWDTFEPEIQKYPPFSELYELDITSKKSFSQIQMLLKYFLKQKCGCVQVKDKDVTNGYKAAPLTKLNPRFIVKPVLDESLKHPVPPTKSKKHSVTLEFSSKFNKNRGSISPKTMKSLQKNYVKLLKTKAKSH